MGSNYVAVVSVLSNYFDGLYNSDTSILSKVFHPAAHYVCVTDGTFQRLTLEEYFPMVDQRSGPSSLFTSGNLLNENTGTFIA